MRYKPSLKSFKEQLRAVIDGMNESGDIQTGLLHEDDSLFTVFQSWEDVHKILTMTLLLSGKYHLYRKALRFAASKPESYNKPTFIQYYDKRIQLVEDLRLGRADLFPYDDQAYFHVPDSVQPYESIMEELIGDYGFADEYSTCDECGKIIHTGPDSYSWSPDYVILNECELIHVDCVDTESVLEEYKNKNKALPDVIQSRAIESGLLVELSDYEYSNGLHSGMNDDPSIIIKTFNRAGIDLWFNVNPSQFYVDFTVLVHPDNKDRAGEILSHLDVYQGYDTASEMEKALKGQHSDYITVKKYTLTPEQFINGIRPDESEE